MRRRSRTLLLLLAGGAGGAVALAGALPEGFQSVSAVVSNPSDWAGREVHVKALVAGPIEPLGSGATFYISDTRGTLKVVWPSTLPDGFEEGRTVVVAGTVSLAEDGPVLLATDIQGGCASRYEPSIG